MKYRVVVFDTNHKFKTLHIVDTEEQVKEKTRGLDIDRYEVYKCNDKGNNYTHREILNKF